MGSAATLLKNRSPGLAKLYRRLETTIKGFGDVEVVTRKRYALFRTARIFADLTVMQDALRLVIHLGRKASLPCFIKIGPSGRRVSHVVLVGTAEEPCPPSVLPSFRATVKRSLWTKSELRED